MIKRHNIFTLLIGLALLLALPNIALADAHEPNSGDTAWMLTSTALVLFMTIPWPRPLLRRPRTHQKCLVCSHAVFRPHSHHDPGLGYHRL